MIPLPTLIFDGDCGYCRKWVNRWRKINPSIQYVSYQDYSKTYPSPPLADLKRSVYFLENGQIYRAAHAVFQLSRTHPLGHVLLLSYRYLPPFRWVSEAIYSFVARIRRKLSGPNASCDIGPT